MKSYEVRYRKTGTRKWNKIKGVIDDSVYVEMIETPRGIQPMGGFPIKVFITQSKQRIEIPMLDHVFMYSSEKIESDNEKRLDVERKIKQNNLVNNTKGFVNGLDKSK